MKTQSIVSTTLTLIVCSLVWCASPLCAQIKWGGAYSGNWSAGANWNGGGAPGAGNNVVIDALDFSQPDYWVNLDVDAIVNHLTLSSTQAGLSLSGRTFETTNGAQLSAGKTSLFDSTWNTSGTISNGGSFRIHSLTANGNSSTINGDFSNWGTLDFLSDGASSSLTVNGDFSNTGNMTIENNNGRSSSLNVNSGVTTNSGIIIASSPTSGTAGNTNFALDVFNNSGQVVNESGALMNFHRAGSVYTNSNIFSGTNGGFSFSNFTSFDNSLTGNMQATSLTMTGSGSATSQVINAGHIGVASGSMHLQSLDLTNSGTIAGAATSHLTLSSISSSQLGAISGFGSMSVSNSTIGMTSGWTWDADVSVANSTFTGAGVTNAAGKTAAVNDATFSHLFSNAGDVTQSITGGNRINNLNGGFTNQAGATYNLTAQASGVNSTNTLNVDGNIDNAGTIQLVNSSPFSNRSSTSEIDHTNGTFTNQAGGLIESSKGAATFGNRTNTIDTDNLVNNGTIRNNYAGQHFTFNRDDASYLNNGLIDGATSTIWFNDLGSFTNSATGQIQGHHFFGYGLSSASSTFSNAGSFNMTDGGITLLDLMTIDNSGTMSVTGGNLAVSTYGTFNNSGAITSAAGRSVSFSGGTLNHQAGGSITGGDSLALSGTTLNLGVDFTTDFGSVSMSNASVNGPGKYTNDAASTMTLAESTFATELINQGMASQSITGGNRINNLNGGFTNQAGATYNLIAQASGVNSTNTLNVDGDIDNAGTIQLVNSSPFSNRSSTSEIDHTNGTFTNQAGGLIESSKGAATFGNRTNTIDTDDLVNNGTIRNNYAGQHFTFNRDDASYVNNGLIDGANSSFWFNDVGSFTNSATGQIQGHHFYGYGLSPASSTFSNAGSFNMTDGGVTLLDLLTIDNSGTMSVTGGNLAVSSYGTFNNSGAITSAAGRSVSFSGGTLNHQAGGSISGGDSLAFSGTTFNLDVDFTTDFGNASLSNATVNGPGKYSNAAGTMMTLAETTFATQLVNDGMISQSIIGSTRNNHLNGGLMNQAGATFNLTAQASSVNSTNILNVDGDIDNAGTIQLVNSSPFTNRSSTSEIRQARGTLTNQVGGLIESSMGAATYANRTNTINTDHFLNEGTIRNNYVGQYFTFNRDGAMYENNGLIDGLNGSFWFNDLGAFINESGGQVQGHHFFGYGLSMTTSTFNNEGTFSMTNGGITLLDLLSIDNSGTFNALGGSFAVSTYGTFNNSGAIHGAAGQTISFSGGTYNHQAGASVNGADSLTFSSTILNLDVGFSTDIVNTTLNNAIVNGPGSYSNQSGNVLGLIAATFNTGLDNSGHTIQNAVGFSRTSSFNNGLSNEAGGTFSIVAQASSLNVTNQINVDGNINNSGTIELAGSSPFSNRNGSAFLNQTNGMLVNQAGGVIEGIVGGTTYNRNNFVRTDNLENYGTIRNSNGAFLYFDRDDAVYFNQGVVEAASGHVYFDDVQSFTNGVSGLIVTSGGNVYIDGPDFVNDGTITGTHALVLSGGAQLINNGDLAPGNSPGTLSIIGNTVFNDTASLMIELGGTVQGIDYDLLDVNGSISLDGELAIEFVNGFLPQFNDVFTIVDAASLTGHFDNAVSEYVFNQGTFQVLYDGSSVQLFNFIGVPEPAVWPFLVFATASLCRRRRS